jgi:predicted PurR-regulated permease PerM
MRNDLLTKTIKVLAFLVLLIVALYYARPFLIPLTFAGLLSMLLLPLVKKLEQKKWNRALSVLVAELLFVFSIAIIIGLLWWQLSSLLEDANSLEQKFNQKIAELQQFLSKKFGIPVKKQQEVLQGEGGRSKLAAMIASAFGTITSVLVNFILVLVYIFLFIFYREHLKTFILKLVPQNKKTEVTKTIDDIQKVSSKYITGLSVMIICLWVMYGIGFSIVGVRNAIFFAVLCGILEIIPFVGNLTGSLLTVAMTLLQGGSSGMIVGVIITYGVVQFIQTYLLEPLVVGSEVDINPLFTILALIMGELIWGIPGMILAIPLMGITKIICQHVEPLRPYAFVIGPANKKANTKWSEKLKKLFH